MVAYALAIVRLHIVSEMEISLLSGFFVYTFPNIADLPQISPMHGGKTKSRFHHVCDKSP